MEDIRNRWINTLRYTLKFGNEEWKFTDISETIIGPSRVTKQIVELYERQSYAKKWDNEVDSRNRISPLCCQYKRKRQENLWAKRFCDWKVGHGKTRKRVETVWSDGRLRVHSEIMKQAWLQRKANMTSRLWNTFGVVRLDQ